MKKLFAVFFVFFLLFVSRSTSAQQWNDMQKDVWAGVNAYWQAGMSDDPAEMLSYFDDSYVGWSNENEAPSTKDQVTKSMKYWSKKGKSQYFNITPAKIWVNGDFAFVHYYYTIVNEGSDGKPTTERGRWTDILTKKNGKWMLIGDHGGAIKHQD